VINELQLNTNYLGESEFKFQLEQFLKTSITYLAELQILEPSLQVEGLTPNKKY